MISRADTFRKNADDCREFAERAVKSPDKDRWRKIAQQWLQLAQEAQEADRVEN
jgi:hypothetical protein